MKNKNEIADTMVAMNNLIRNLVVTKNKRQKNAHASSLETRDKLLGLRKTNLRFEVRIDK